MEKLKINPQELLRHKENMPTSEAESKELKTYRQKLYEGFDRDFRIPNRFCGKTFENFNSPIDGLVNKVKNSLASGDSLFFSGSCGSGKTHLAIASARYWYSESAAKRKCRDYYGQEREGTEFFCNDKIKFIPSVELFLILKQSFDDDKQTELEILNEFTKPDLLVIDDVGSEKVSDWSRQIFYTIIDRRYRNIQQTIITSNLTLDKLGESIDDRISSRIVEMGKIFNLGEKDNRIK